MHLLVIFGIALLVFGPKNLPELGKGIGEGKFDLSANCDSPSACLAVCSVPCGTFEDRSWTCTIVPP